MYILYIYYCGILWDNMLFVYDHFGSILGGGNREPSKERDMGDL